MKNIITIKIILRKKLRQIIIINNFNNKYNLRYKYNNKKNKIINNKYSNIILKLN